MMALTICAVPGSRPLRLLISASFRAPATAPEAKPAPVAHDAANSRMHGNLSSASVVLHVVSETECLLTEDRGKFLLLLDLLLVKDSAELVECVLFVTAQSRDVLRGILPDVDGILFINRPQTIKETFKYCRMPHFRTLRFHIINYKIRSSFIYLNIPLR